MRHSKGEGRERRVNSTDHKQRLDDLLKRKILVAGDANGTRIQALDLSADDFGGPEYEGCNEYLNLVLPQVVQEIHRAYLEAGVDIVITNSFGSTPLVAGRVWAGAPRAGDKRGGGAKRPCSSG